MDSVRPFWEPDPKGDDDSDEEESSDDDHEDDDEDLEDVKPSTTRASRSLGKAVSKRVKASPKQNSSKIETEDPRERKWERKWERKMSTIKADVEAHIDDNRVWVIKQIISATTDEDIADLSENAQDYDEQTYGTDFFKTITSHFILKRGETGRRTSWTHDKKYVAVPYPDVLKDTPVPSTSALRVRIIRAILDVGELDEDTATVEDLDALGHLCWLDWVGPKREKALWTWTELVSPQRRTAIMLPSRADTLAFSRARALWRLRSTKCLLVHTSSRNPFASASPKICPRRTSLPRSRNRSVANLMTMTGVEVERRRGR